MTDKIDPKILGGAAVALLLSFLVLGFVPTVLLALAAGGVAYFVLKSKDGAPATRPAHVAAPPAAMPPPTPTWGIHESAPEESPAQEQLADMFGRPDATEVLPPIPSSTPELHELTTAIDVINAIRSECLEKHFFTKHQVKATKGTRNNPATATMTAVPGAGKSFVVTVTATEFPYGMHINCEWGEKGQGLGSALAINAMGDAARRGYNAGKEHALKKKAPGLEMEMQAFQQQILNKYLAS